MLSGTFEPSGAILLRIPPEHPQYEAVAGVIVQSRRAIALSAADDGGRWITIGGKAGEDGKKHGGSPVYIKNGRIVKGHPSLTGKKIDALKEPAEHAERKHGETPKQERAFRAAETRGERQHEAGYQRALWGKKAKAEGIDPKSLHQTAAEILAHDKAFKSEMTGVLQDARSMLSRMYGTDVRTLATTAGRGKIDASHVRGLDAVAQSLASTHPHFFGGSESSEERLFDLLVSGNPEPMTEEDAYGEAMDQLHGMKPREPEESENSDASATDIGEFNPSEWEPEKPTIAPDEIKDAKKLLAGGQLKVGQGDETSALSGHPIRHHVTLPSGAKIHPDELHRALVDEGKVILNPHEGLSVKDPMGDDQHSSFGKALHAVTAFQGRDDDRITLQSPHGYNVTRTRGEWRDLEHSGEPFHVWYDRESPEAVSEAARKSEKPAATIGNARDTENFFAPQTDQGSLYKVATKAAGEPMPAAAQVTKEESRGWHEHTETPDTTPATPDTAPAKAPDTATDAKALYEAAASPDFDYAQVDSFVEQLHKGSKDDANTALAEMGYSKQGTKAKAIERIETLIKNRRQAADISASIPKANATPEQLQHVEEAGKRADGEPSLHDKLHAHLRENPRTPLADLRKQFGDGAEHDPQNPQAHPVHQALKEMRDSGRVEAHESERGEPRFSAKGESPVEPAAAPKAEGGISIAGQGAGSVPVKEHLSKLKALYDDFQNQDYETLDKELSVIGSDLTTETAKQLAKGFGILGRWKNRQALMEDIRTRIANRREAYMATHWQKPKPTPAEPVGSGTPLESLHEKRVRHAAMSQAIDREDAIAAARLLVRAYLDAE